MPKLTMARAMSWRSPIMLSITTTEPASPSAAAANSKRGTWPRFTGARPDDSWAISSSVRIATPFFLQVLALQSFIQGFDRPMHAHFDGGFRHAGALGRFGHRHAIQLDVLDQFALGGRQLVQQLGH